MSAATIRVLAGDTGGTNTRLAIFDVIPGVPPAEALRRVHDARYSSKDPGGLGAIVLRYLAECGHRPERATFGIAGPVRDGRVQATNLPWAVDSRDLAKSLGLPRVALLNDLEANAWGLRALPASALVTLQEGAPGAAGNGALISAGTGLGEAGLFWDGREHRPFACEGGHATFAPRTPLELALFEDLARRFGHVSWERVLSGPGVVNVHEFLLRHRGAADPPWLAEAALKGETAAAISKLAIAGTDELAIEALDLVIGFYGAEAGNLALKTMATGGVWVGGGIAPKILPRLIGPRFTNAFRDKGRMRPLLDAMPVRVVNEDRTALLGAAWHAAFEQVKGD